MVRKVDTQKNREGSQYAVNADVVESDSINTDTLNNGATITDGDGKERQIYIISSGDSAPDEADPEDLIFEEK